MPRGRTRLKSARGDDGLRDLRAFERPERERRHQAERDRGAAKPRGAGAVGADGQHDPAEEGRPGRRPERMPLRCPPCRVVVADAVDHGGQAEAVGQVEGQVIGAELEGPGEQADDHQTAAPQAPQRAGGGDPLRQRHDRRAQQDDPAREAGVAAVIGVGCRV